MPVTGSDEERPLSLGALDQIVSDRLERHAALERVLNLSMDGLHAHLRVCPGQDSHDGPAHCAELTATIRPSGGPCIRSAQLLVRDLRCETLEKVSERVV